jgi:hypothetical protein
MAARMRSSLCARVHRHERRDRGNGVPRLQPDGSGHSELSATSAPTRVFLLSMLPVGSLLLIAFGIGVWITADGYRTLRMVGGFLVAFGITGVAWLPFPMTSREDMEQGVLSPNDLGHLILSALTVRLIVVILGFGAATIHNLTFRVYSVVTVSAVLGFGAVVAMQAPKVGKGLPTPWMGLFERINVHGFMLWLAVFAVVLLRAQSTSTTVHSAGRDDRDSSDSPAPGGRSASPDVPARGTAEAVKGEL